MQSQVEVLEADRIGDEEECVLRDGGRQGSAGRDYPVTILGALAM